MKDVGILTIGPSDGSADSAFRNDVAELEGRLRFIFTGWALHPVFGGEPLHPGDRLVTSLALGRLHLHHVVESGACVLVLLLVGDADASIASALARYADARVRPPYPLFVVGSPAPSPAAFHASIRVAGELRALGRAHEAVCAPIREDDPAFYAFAERIERARDGTRAVARDASFRDDLRRHHHLRVCPRDAAPVSWRLPPLHALAVLGVTTSVVSSDELGRRTRWILGANAIPLDPRLLQAPARNGADRPGALAERAVALAIRDLGDERLAFSGALGPELPGGADPGRVAAILNGLRDPSGAMAPPLSTATGDDDAGALTLHLLQRAALPPPDGRPFLDPTQERPGIVAEAFAITGTPDGLSVAATPLAPGRTASTTPGAAEVTIARASFGIGPPRLVCFETEAAAGPDGSLRIVVPGGVPELVAHWPADRLACIPGRHAARLEALARGIGFEVSRLRAPRSSASVPRSSGA